MGVYRFSVCAVIHWQKDSPFGPCVTCCKLIICLILQTTSKLLKKQASVFRRIFIFDKKLLFVLFPQDGVRVLILCHSAIFPGMCFWFRMKGENTTFIMRHPVQNGGLRSAGAFLQEFVLWNKAGQRVIQTEGWYFHCISGTIWSQQVPGKDTMLSLIQGTGASLSASISHFHASNNCRLIYFTFTFLHMANQTTYLSPKTSSSFTACQQPLQYLWTLCSEMLTLHREVTEVLGSCWWSLWPSSNTE